MTEDKVTSITVEENGSKVNEPGATPQDAAHQVEKKEEAVETNEVEAESKMFEALKRVILRVIPSSTALNR